ASQQRKSHEDTPMPLLRLDDGLDLHYRIDDFTDPWKTPETALFFHGIADSGDAWYAWTPPFARRFRVLRPDMRGYGRSTPVPPERKWSLERLAADYELLLRHLKLDRVHLIGAKIGGMTALYFAATRPDMVRPLTVVGAPASGKQIP